MSLQALARELLDAASSLGLLVATAESCTGGMVAAAITDIAGSSAVLDCGFVTYSNEAKSAMLGVAPELIAEHGAVSEPVARAMAQGALGKSRADAAVSITGIAGPGGGSREKPVGLVHFAIARRGAPTVHSAQTFGDLGRHEVRLIAARYSLKFLSTSLAQFIEP
ncbi:CinA family protein [Breoghania sp. L-A4]|uniref:CinA family protein n=1 Tax=Breoghania sp. L-A4 TaxID=2304600 RepID=UPI0020BEF0E0|nr:CinA family protein [Breoghania sp. L-A4]